MADSYSEILHDFYTISHKKGAVPLMPSPPEILTIPSFPLPYYLESGAAAYTPGEQHPNRRGLGVYDLIAVQEGALLIGEEDREWTVQPGQMLLLHPRRYHYSRGPCQVATRFYWLHFGVDGDPDKNRQQTYEIHLPQYWTLPAPSRIFQLFEGLLRLFSAPRSEAFWQEQTLFLELLKQLDESRFQREGSRAMAVAEATEALIRARYREPLTNRLLEEELHYHPNYLARCMKEVRDMTPLEYLMQYRLEQARLLLLKTDWSMARIAEEVGFGYASYFSRCFTSRNGITPLQFRKQYSL